MKYAPTEADKLTGARLRQLRKRRGETMQQTIDRSGVKLKQSAFSRTELGERRLTEIEAAKLAAHFNVAVSQILQPAPGAAVTEQAWLGNEDPKPALFAVPEPSPLRNFDPAPGQLVIELDNPMPAEQYRQTVWLPFLEARYAKEAS